MDVALLTVTTITLVLLCYLSLTIHRVAMLLNTRNDVKMSSYLDYIFQYEVPINLISKNYNFGQSLVLDFTMCDFVDFRKKIEIRI